MTRLDHFAAAAISGLCAGPVQIRLGGKYGFDQQAVNIAVATAKALDLAEYRESEPGKIALRALKAIANGQLDLGGAIMLAKLTVDELEQEAAS